MLRKPKPFKIDHDRFYYEPRVLWSVARVGNTLDVQSETQPRGFVKLDKVHYMNGTPYPFRITHAIVSPVGYLFRERDALAGFVPDPGFFDQAMAGIGRMAMRIAFPKSSWIERLETDVMSFGTEATGEPVFDGDASLDYSSGLLGLSRWTFDPSYIVRAKGTIDLSYSTIQRYQPSGSPTGYGSMLVHERGGRMLGHGRTRAPEALEYGTTWNPTNPAAWPESHAPIIGDAYAANVGVSGPQPKGFPPSGAWPSNLYWHQLASRGLPWTEVTGFAVALDQIAIDDAVFAGFGGTNVRVAPLAQRIITKGRTRDAGTQERWWRDGAPLSLVTPTQNNCGFVHRWDEPFWLGPGEGLEVALQAPPPRTITVNGQPVTINPVYNVGVSFLGYAVVEDNVQKVYRSPA